MTTKLNQKLLEDLRLQKQILLIAEKENRDGCIDPKQPNGSYGFPSSADILQPYHNKRPINPRADAEDHGFHEYAIFDDEYHGRRHSVSTVSALNKTQRRSYVAEESWKQYNETSTSFKAFRDLPFYYHYNNFTDSNSILNKRESLKGIRSIKNSAHEHAIAGMTTTSTRRESGGGDVNNSRMQQLEFDYYNNRRIKRVSQRHQPRRSSVDLGEFNLQQQYLSDSDHNVMQGQTYLQLREISRDAQKLSDTLKLNSNVPSDGLIGRDLLKGAMDLEESLRMLAKLQKAAKNLKISDVHGRRAAENLPREFMALPNNSNAKVLQLEEPRNSYSGSSHPQNYHLKELKTPNGSKESTTRTTSSSIDLREAIKSSLSRQKLLYSKRNSSAGKKFDDDDDDDRHGVKNSESTPANSNANQQDGKRRIPNVIARLMGLEELPVETRPKTTNADNSRNSKVPSLQAQDLRLGHPPPINPDAMNSLVASKSRNQGLAKGSRSDQKLQATNLRQQQDSERRTTVRDKKSIEADPAYIKPKDQFHDTVKAALDRAKHRVAKPSVEFELLEKNPMRKHVDVDQDRKTLKDILESMQIKEILHPQFSGDGPLHESNINSNRQNFRAGQKPERTKIQQEQKQYEEQTKYVRGGNMPEISSTDHGTRRNSNDNKIGREATTIVIMKPVAAKLQSPKMKQTQLHVHEPESTSGRTKQIQGINSVKVVSTSISPSKRKLGKGALGIKPDDGQSKKYNSNSDSHGGSRDSVIDHGGGHQKLLKPTATPRPSSPPPPASVLQELKRRRNERISRTDKKHLDVSSRPSTNPEKKELVQTDPSNRIKKKVSVATKSIPVFVSGSTGTFSLDMQHKSDEKLPKEVKPAQSHDALTIERDEEEEEDQESSISTSSGSHQAKPVISNVASLECASEEADTTPCELQAAVQHSSIADHSSASVIPDSALELPAEEPHENRSEDGESSTHIHLNDSGHVKRDISSQPISKSSYEELPDNITGDGYGDVDAKGAEFGEEYSLKWQAGYVRQILMNNPTLANSGGAESCELYPQLYHKLEAQEAAMYPDNTKRGARHGDHDSIAQRLVFDCVKELLKRKSKRRVQVNQPTFTGMRVSPAMKTKNIEGLVKELNEDIGELVAYHELPSCDKDAPRDEKFGSDSFYTMLKKDLHLRHDVNSIWESSWDYGRLGEGEGQEIVRDIEKVILEELLEEVILDQVSL